MDHSPGFLAHAQARRAHVHEVGAAEAHAAISAGASSPDGSMPGGDAPTGARLIDVREDREFMAEHAAGATHMGRGVIERDIEKAVPDKAMPLYLYCGGGFRSALAADALQQMGYTNVHSIAGGWRAWLEAGLPTEKPDARPRVTGIGGVFLKSADPVALRAWYERHLGVGQEAWGAMFPFREHAAPQVEGYVVWSVSPNDSTYFGESGQTYMVNYRVRDLDTLLEQLQGEGVWIDPKRDDGEFGKFAWIRDADGNRIELWQPAGDPLP